MRSIVMPRPKRIDLPGLAHHLIVRGNNRHVIFPSDDDRSYFLECLGEARGRRQCDIHAFVLMPNHVHLLATARKPSGMSRMMQDIGRAYVKRLNSKYRRTGALYEGRFKSSLVETRRYFMTCMRYIELNPVRARMVSHPAQFPWSSFRQNIAGDPRGLLTPHPEYLALGSDAQARADAYCGLFEHEIDAVELEVIRQCAEQGCALGDDEFCQAVEGMLGRRVTYTPKGRPAVRA